MNVFSFFLYLRNWAILISLFGCTYILKAQSQSEIVSYIAQYKHIAIEHEKKYGIPATITLAQGILESGAGKSTLTRNANNHFGIKALGGWNGDIYLAWDDEAQKSKFRRYESASDSYQDHSLFLNNNNRYRHLFLKSVYDYRAWAIGLQAAGYATAPNYAKALIGIIDAYKLYALNGGVKLRPGRIVTITKVISSEAPMFNEECIMSEQEKSEEEVVFETAVSKFVVSINDVRCTTLYPGETLSSISQKHDVPLHLLLEYNELSDGSNLKEGDVIYLQKKKKRYTGLQDFYIVKAGETLYDIAQKYGIMLANLAKMNDKSFFSSLREGEKLYLK